MSSNLRFNLKSVQKSFLFFNKIGTHSVLGKKKGRKTTVSNTRHCQLKLTINSNVVCFFCFFKSCFALWLRSENSDSDSRHSFNQSHAKHKPIARSPAFSRMWACCTPSTLWSLGLEWTVLITSVLIWRCSIVRVRHLMRNKMKAQTLARLNHC